MDIIPYGKKYPDVTKLLYDKGYLRRYPKQHKRDDLQYDDGIDIVYDLKNLPPAKFTEASDLLLLAAYTEAQRYKDATYKFAKFMVHLNRTAQGKKQVKKERGYIASRHRDPEIMVYGEQGLGYELPEEEKKPFLINKVQEILGIPDSPSPGPYVKKQQPYKVIRLTIGIRAGKMWEGVPGLLIPGVTNVSEEATEE